MRDVKQNWWTTAFVAAFLFLSAGCSGGTDDATSPSATPTAAPTGASSDSETTTAPPASASDFSGTWAGEYQQTSPTTASGSFTIVWEQSGSELTGTITIPDLCPSGCPISASVSGSDVTFGVVATSEINYTGTIAGDTMTGTYATTDNSGEGTWTATRTG